VRQSVAAARNVRVSTNAQMISRLPIIGQYLYAY
jgi:hypothetical protein